MVIKKSRRVVSMVMIIGLLMFYTNTLVFSQSENTLLSGTVDKSLNQSNTKKFKKIGSNISLHESSSSVSPQVVSTQNNSSSINLKAVSYACSSQLPEWSGSQALDGNNETCWSSYGYSYGNCIEYITFNAGIQCLINQIEMVPRIYGYGFPVDFEIQASNDGINFTTIPGQKYVGYQNPGGNTPQEFKFSAINAQYIRVYATKLGQDDYKNYYFQLAELKVFSTQDKFTVNVTDSNTLQPISGADVNIQGVDVLTNDKGIAEFEDIEPGLSDIYITKEGYDDDYYPEYNVDYNGCYNSFLSSDDSDIASVILEDDEGQYNVATEEKEYDEDTEDDQSTPSASVVAGSSVPSAYVQAYDTSVTPLAKGYVNIKINASGKSKPTQYMLIQNNKVVLHNATGIFKNVKVGSVFKKGYKVYSVIQYQNGKKSKKKELKLTVFPSINPAKEVEVGDESPSAVAVPDSWPIIGGFDISEDQSLFPVFVKKEGNKFRAIVGLFSNDEEGYHNNYKELSDNWKEKYSEVKKFTQEFTKNHMGGSWLKNTMKENYQLGGGVGPLQAEGKAVGYIEGTIKGGQLSLTSGKIVITGEISKEFKKQFLVGDVPAYLKITGSLEVSTAGGISKYDNGHLVPSVEGTITPSFEIEGGVGVCDVLSIGANGQAKLELNDDIEKNYFKVTFTGKGTIKATAFIWSKDVLSTPKFEATWNSDTRKWITQTKSSYVANDNQENAYNKEGYTLMPRNYTKNTTSWLGNKPVRLDGAGFTNKEIKTLETNIFPNAEPKIASVGDKKVMVWIGDNLGRTSANRTMLEYSIYDKANDTWSVAKAVYDDGTADYYPQMCSDGNNMYVTWQNSKTAFNDDVTMEEAEKASEISVAKFNPDKDSFDNSVAITNNDTLDTQPQIAVSNGKAGVVWTSNSLNDIFGTTGMNTIYYSEINENGEFSEAKQLVENQNAITSLNTAYIDNKLTAAYVPDDDNDMNTIDDRDIYIVKPNEQPTKLTNNTTLDSNPIFSSFNGTTALYWYNDGNIMYLPNLSGTPSKVFSEPKESLRDDFKVVTNSQGKTAVIWTETNDEKEEIYAAIYDQTKGVWSQGVKISNLGSRIKSPTGVFDDQGVFNIAFNKVTTLDTGEEQSDLCTLKVTPSYNLAVDGVDFDERELSIDGQLPVSIDVINKGELNTDNLKVEVIDGTTVVYTGVVAQSIKPGETAEVDTTIALPDTSTKKTYTVKVTPMEGEEYDTSDNTKDISVGYTDLSLGLTRYNVNGNELVSVKVSNLSCMPTGAVIKMRANSEDGEVIQQQTVSQVVYGADKYSMFKIDPKSIDFGSDTIKQYYFTVESTAEESNTSDNSEYIVIEKPKSSEANILSITSPVNAVIDSTANTVAGSVYNGVNAITLNIGVSPNATWGLYSDADCETEITDKTMNLIAGENTAYIRVVAEDETEKIYPIKIQKVKYGDLDGNGIVDYSDYTCLKDYILRKIDSFPTQNLFSGINPADLNGDGKATSIDAAYLIRYLKGIITKFPVEK